MRRSLPRLDPRGRVKLGEEEAHSAPWLKAPNQQEANGTWHHEHPKLIGEYTIRSASGSPFWPWNSTR